MDRRVITLPVILDCCIAAEQFAVCCKDWAYPTIRVSRELLRYVPDSRKGEGNSS